MEQFKVIIEIIHRFEKAVKNVSVPIYPPEDRSFVETEYHASKTELLNVISRLVREREVSND